MAEQFVRRPYLNMYKFLIDEFTAHLARAIQERLNDHMEAATEALRDAQQALNDFLMLTKEHYAYQKAFERLLRDLKAEG